MHRSFLGYLGGMKKYIMDAATDKDIEGIRQIKVRVPVPDQYSEENVNTVEVPLISSKVLALIDNMLFVSYYGHRVML
jgi:hypothetical protein